MRNARAQRVGEGGEVNDAGETLTADLFLMLSSPCVVDMGLDRRGGGTL